MATRSLLTLVSLLLRGRYASYWNAFLFWLPSQEKYLALEAMIYSMVNNSDLETRVEALETGLSLVNGDIDNLQDSQIVQDERFLAVEIDITDLEDSFTGNLPNICGYCCSQLGIRYSMTYEVSHSAC